MLIFNIFVVHFRTTDNITWHLRLLYRSVLLRVEDLEYATTSIRASINQSFVSRMIDIHVERNETPRFRQGVTNGLFLYLAQCCVVCIPQMQNVSSTIATRWASQYSTFLQNMNGQLGQCQVFTRQGHFKSNHKHGYRINDIGWNFHHTKPICIYKSWWTRYRQSRLLNIKLWQLTGLKSVSVSRNPINDPQLSNSLLILSAALDCGRPLRVSAHPSSVPSTFCSRAHGWHTN